MKYDNKLAKKSIHNAWHNWRGQFASEDEAAIVLIRVINSRVKNNSKIKKILFTRKNVKSRVVSSFYKLKDKFLLYFEQQGYLTACYPDNIFRTFQCRNCREGCVVCHGNKYIYNKVLYKKIFNLNNKQYAFHTPLKSKDSDLLINQIYKLEDKQPFTELNQIDFDIERAIKSLNVFFESIPTEKKITSIRLIQSLHFDSVESIKLFN